MVEANDKLILVIKCKGTDNIIGLKEDIAMKLENVVGIERIEVLEDELHCDDILRKRQP